MSEDEIANAAGISDMHDGVNFMRAACVIAVEKVRRDRKINGEENNKNKSKNINGRIKKKVFISFLRKMECGRSKICDDYFSKN